MTAFAPFPSSLDRVIDAVAAAWIAGADGVDSLFASCSSVR